MLASLEKEGRDITLASQSFAASGQHRLLVRTGSHFKDGHANYNLYYTVQLIHNSEADSLNMHMIGKMRKDLAERMTGCKQV